MAHISHNLKVSCMWLLYKNTYNLKTDVEVPHIGRHVLFFTGDFVKIFKHKVEPTHVDNLYYFIYTFLHYAEHLIYHLCL